MDEMKPCPFCGRRGRIKKYSDDRYRAVCENHICPVESFDYHTAKEAQDWWNKRHDPERDRWISVEERLPVGGDKSGAVCEDIWMLFDDGSVFCGWMNGCTETAYYLDGYNDFVRKCPISRVRAWQPKPEPPKEET